MTHTVVTGGFNALVHDALPAADCQADLTDGEPGGLPAGWTREQVDSARRLWRCSGLSASQIGRAVGKSKDAVTNLSNRRGWGRRGGPIRPARPPQPERIAGSARTLPDMGPTPAAAPLGIAERPTCSMPVNDTKPYLFCTRPVQGRSAFCAECRRTGYLQRPGASHGGQGIAA